MKKIFFRNDDVGMHSPTNTVANDLINLTEFFIENNVPICHSVVPKLVNKKTVKWLQHIKQKTPDLLSIGQHGYLHQKYVRGEFGGGRSYDDQFNDILHGKLLMDELFKGSFSLWFAPPWVQYDKNTKLICEKLGFQIFSGGVSPKFEAIAFNRIGNILNYNVFLNKEVSYHRKSNYIQKGFQIQEVSVSIDVVKNYNTKELKPCYEIIDRFEKSIKKYNTVGFMLHQWIFDSNEKIELLNQIIDYIKLNHKNYQFLSFDQINVTNQFLKNQVY